MIYGLPSMVYGLWSDYYRICTPFSGNSSRDDPCDQAISTRRTGTIARPLRDIRRQRTPGYVARSVTATLNCPTPLNGFLAGRNGNCHGMFHAGFLAVIAVALVGSLSIAQLEIAGDLAAAGFDGDFQFGADVVFLGDDLPSGDPPIRHLVGTGRAMLL